MDSCRIALYFIEHNTIITAVVYFTLLYTQDIIPTRMYAVGILQYSDVIYIVAIYSI